MTQVKKTNEKPQKLNKTALNLQKKFLSLSQREQQGVTCFFNAHNTAHFIYEGLSEEAQAYITFCISMSNKADKIEENNSAQVS